MPFDPFCPCHTCLKEAAKIRFEPLNSTKPTRKSKPKKQYAQEKWSTLGQPSGKWDYYVRYDTPTLTPLQEIVAMGWDDPPPTIEAQDYIASDSSDDESSYLNFLNSLPSSSGSTTPIPLAQTECGGTIQFITKTEAETEAERSPVFGQPEDTLDYPKLKRLEEHVNMATSSSGVYNPPTEPTTGRQAVYPPGGHRYQEQTIPSALRRGRFRGGYNHLFLFSST